MARRLALALLLAALTAALLWSRRAPPRDPALAEAMRLAEAGDLAGAARAGAERGRPSHWLNHVGVALVREGRNEAARRTYLAATPAEPPYALVWINLGWHLQKGGDLDGAEAAYREALRLAPEDAMALNNLGTILLGRDREEAAGLLARAASGRSEWFPHAPAFAHANLGRLREDARDAAGALCRYEAALEIDPGQGLALAGLERLGAPPPDPRARGRSGMVESPAKEAP